MARHATVGLLALGLALFSCQGDEESGEGTLVLEIWGEEYIEDGIPATEFEDGWSVTFSKFVVLVHDPQAGPGTDDTGRQSFLPGCTAIDLVKKGPVVLDQMEVPSGEYHDTSYSIRPAEGDCRSAANAPGDLDLQNMADKGYSVLVAGNASKTGKEVSFEWGFTRETHYTHCASTAVVKAGEEASIQLTIHGDHLFYDSLTNPGAVLRFQVLAEADSNDDGDVTMEELAAFGGDTFKALDNYDVGGQPVETLYDYLQEQSATLGHIDGEGHCEVQ